MNNFWISIIFSIIAIIMSVTAMAIALPRVSLGFDYIGVIVAILALLVTVLIGWNIFYALDMKKEFMSKLDKIRNECKEQLKMHSDLNNKEFNNILATMKRSEKFCNKLDESILYLLKNQMRSEEL